MSEAIRASRQRTSTAAPISTCAGISQPARPVLPAGQRVCRALHVLKVANERAIVTVNSIYTETAIPRPTIVRILSSAFTGSTRR